MPRFAYLVAALVAVSAVFGAPAQPKAEVIDPWEKQADGASLSSIRYAPNPRRQHGDR